MPRRPRFVVPGVAHHVTQRGNNRQDVFFSDQDRVHYLQMLGQYSLRHGCRVLAWCLMTNHVHLILIPGSQRSMALTLGQTHSQYSLELNRQQSRIGHLWQNRFFSCPLDGSHLLAAMHYVELNPVRAGLSGEAWDWPWSSARAHCSSKVSDELLDWPWMGWMEEARFGVWNHADWKEALTWKTPQDNMDQVRRATKLGEPLGSESFVKELETRAGRRLRVLAQGRPRVEKSFAAGGEDQLLLGN
jgi:REP-associated tyrosine transposase